MHAKADRSLKRLNATTTKLWRMCSKQNKFAFASPQAYMVCIDRTSLPARHAAGPNLSSSSRLSSLLGGLYVKYDLNSGATGGQAQGGALKQQLQVERAVSLNTGSGTAGL